MVIDSKLFEKMRLYSLLDVHCSSSLVELELPSTSIFEDCGHWWFYTLCQCCQKKSWIIM